MKRGLRMKMTSWYVARGRTAACVRLIASYLACSSDDARLLWRKVHIGRIHPAEMDMDPQEDRDAGRMGGEVERKVTGSQATPCGDFASGSQRQEKDGDPQGYARRWRIWNLTFASSLGD